MLLLMMNIRRQLLVRLAEQVTTLYNKSWGYTWVRKTDLQESMWALR